MLSFRLSYYNRIFTAYFTKNKSHLTFWHTGPEINENLKTGELGEYYMPFLGKADYPGHIDEMGIPMLDYHGGIGLQYNPIAIAQYGLGNYNLFCRTRDPERRHRFLQVADWLVDNLEQNTSGLWMWMHHFDWEYRDTLVAPWYSGLAQGQGISVLLRAFKETSDPRYLESAERAFQGFYISVDEGGVIYEDQNGNIWIEEYIVNPPTHILNGFIWASWGIYDYYLVTGDEKVKELFDEIIDTLTKNLDSFDIGFWSLYEHSGTFFKMVASPFYHKLHIVQLEVLFQLTGNQIFQDYAAKWEVYRSKFINRTFALGYKAIFKFFYY